MTSFDVILLMYIGCQLRAKQPYVKPCCSQTCLQKNPSRSFFQVFCLIIGTWLQNRISLQIPYLYRAEQLDIITNPREMDSSMVAWKGACIMSCLETAQELWIEAGEWQKYGVKVLRERAPFTWQYCVYVLVGTVSIFLIYFS